MRLYSLLRHICLLAPLLAPLLAHAHEVQAILDDAVVGSEGGNAQASYVEKQKSNAAQRSPEGESRRLQVHDALNELRALEKAGNRSARLAAKHGIVGSTVYYAKEAFGLLFMNAPKTDDPFHPQTEKKKLSKPLTKAVRLLEAAAKEKDADAIFILAEMNFYGNFTHPRNYGEAFRLYEELATMTGNATAQHMLGFMYATGIGDAVEQDQAKSMLYHTFAAEAGDTRSEMTVAFRHHTGVAGPRNCDSAAFFYKRVADKAIAYARSGPPGGVTMVRHAYKIADETGGVYGDGASVISSGANAVHAGPNSDQNADFDDVLEYLDWLSRKGDLKARYSLGKLHYDGSRTMRRNFKEAKRYFSAVAAKYWSGDGKVISDDVNSTGKLAAKAASYIGRLYMRGEGVRVNYGKAKKWFKQGLKLADPSCQYHMGLMHLHGLGVRKDTLVAAGYFKEAAQHDWAAAQVQLAKLFLDQGDVAVAAEYFEMASRYYHIEALYHLADLNNLAIDRERSCNTAVTFYKLVAERAESLYTAWEEANAAYDEGDKDKALVYYMMAAEQGYEAAQANVAYILDEHRSILSLDSLMPWRKTTSTFLRNAALALVYWTRSAKQSNVDSFVKMGDYYLQGNGVERDMEKAAACYQAAADSQQSGQALWNLGWMHENGIGIEQDYHLAKRYYDLALEASTEAYLPVKLSLLKLRARSWWNTITHGKINSIQPEPEEAPKYLSWRDWLHKFLLAGQEDQEVYYANDYADDDLDYALPGADEYGAEEIDGDVVETVLFLAMAAALALLVYYRQRIQEARRRATAARARQAADRNAADPAVSDTHSAGGTSTEQQREPEEDRGLFPRDGDDNWNDWVAGGVGH